MNKLAYKIVPRRVGYDIELDIDLPDDQKRMLKYLILSTINKSYQELIDHLPKEDSNNE